MGNDSAKPLWQGLDLSDASRILRHAGRVDPTGVNGDRTAQLQALIDSLCDLSVHDGLTGLVNATFFQAALETELDRTYRTGRATALLLLDIDHFKLVNDSHGHQAGDSVLQALARQLKRSLRSMDTPARTGGEEFAVILPECGAMDAVSAAIRIHTLLNPLVVQSGEHTIRVTTSAGLVWSEPYVGVSAREFISVADEQLYRAKQSGRSRLCHPPLITTQVSRDEKAALVMPRLKEGSHGR